MFPMVLLRDRRFRNATMKVTAVMSLTIMGSCAAVLKSVCTDATISVRQFSDVEEAKSNANLGVFKLLYI